MPRPLRLIVTLLVALILLFWRRPDGFTVLGLWAEDGAVFLKDAHEAGWSSLLRPYNGYFHFVPRLIALLADAFGPPEFLPYFFSYGALLFTLFAIALPFHPRFGLRFPELFGLAIVALPVHSEVYLNVTNLQWILALPLVLVLAAPPPARRAERALDVGLLCLSGLSTVLTLFLLPLFLLKAGLARSRSTSGLAGVAALIALIQGLEIGTRRSAGEFIWHFDWLRLVSRPLFIALYGPEAALETFDSNGVILLALLSLMGLTVLFYAAWRCKAPGAVWSVAALILLSLGTAVAFRGEPQLLVGGGLRYFFLQPILTVWALSFIVETGTPAVRRLSSLLILGSFGLFLLRGAEFSQRYLEPKRWKRNSRCIGVTYPCVVPLSPGDWKMVLERSFREKQ